MELLAAQHEHYPESCVLKHVKTQTNGNPTAFKLILYLVALVQGRTTYGCNKPQTFGYIVYIAFL